MCVIIGNTYQIKLGAYKYDFEVIDIKSYSNYGFYYINDYFIVKCVKVTINDIFYKDLVEYYIPGEIYYPNAKFFIDANPILIKEKDVSTSTNNNSNNGMSCKKCNMHNPYAEPNVGNDYICYNCRD